MRKIVVLHKYGHRSTYKFPGGGNWADHFEMYKRDTDAGLYLGVELWRRRFGVVATGIPGEELWEIVERYPEKD